MPSAHSSISKMEGKFIVAENKPLHTCAAESIDGEGVASIASASIRTICIDTGMLTKVQSFIALMNLYKKISTASCQAIFDSKSLGS